MPKPNDPPPSGSHPPLDDPEARRMWALVAVLVLLGLLAALVGLTA